MDILYGEMATGSGAIGWLLFRYSDVCRRDLREMAIDDDLLEEVAADSGSWRQAVYPGREKSQDRNQQKAAKEE
jgi:hypothetical protein